MTTCTHLIDQNQMKKEERNPLNCLTSQQNSPMAVKEMSLILLVDKERRRVIYAESGKDFVEILLSFLILPTGTIIKLFGQQSKMGSLTMLYQSLEDLDLEFLNTKSCKDMLLHPTICAKELYKNLNSTFDIKPTQYYCCNWGCCTEKNFLISTVESARCRCGKSMTWELSEKDGDVDGGDGVFAKGKMRFMISEDLQVSVVSSSKCFALMREFGVSDASVLEKIKVNVGEDEVLHLLKRLLLSKTPLTDVFLGERDTVDGVYLDLNFPPLDSDMIIQSQTEKDIDSDPREMSVKLFLSKSNQKVLFAEGGEKFVDLLFSFLAFPLGSIVKCLGGCSGMGCLDNLHKSVKDLSFKDCMISEECKAMLLDPKLEPFYGTENQLLQIEEQVPHKPNIFHCLICDGSSVYITGPRTCSHGRSSIQLFTMNPKFPDVVTELGGTFMAGPAMFMVTDDLVVEPLSPISVLGKFNIPIGDIEEQDVHIGEKEAMSLLKASLISNSVLSNVFYSKKPKQMETKSRRRLH